MSAPLRPVSVLHVHSGNLFGGVERMLEAFAAYTPPRGPVDSAFALCFAGRLSASLRAAGAVVHDLGETHVRRPDQIWRARRRLRDLTHRHSYDLVMVHSSWSQALFGPEARNAARPLVRWLHAPDPGPSWMERWAARSRPALVLFNSRYTRDGARDRFDGVRSNVHYPPACCRQATGEGGRDGLRVALGAAETTAVIVMAARLEPLKGHRLLIDALSGLPPLDWQMWVAGGVQRPEEGAYLRALEDAVRANGLDARVRFLGERTDVTQLLQAADVYCQPNQRPEAFGLSFVEAFAAGLPVVTTRLGAAPELIDDSCGMLVSPGSAAELASALTVLLQDPAKRRLLGDGGRARAAALCDLPGSFCRLADTLRAAVSA